jgi:hypothetical protein
MADPLAGPAVQEQRWSFERLFLTALKFKFHPFLIHLPPSTPLSTTTALRNPKACALQVISFQCSAKSAMRSKFGSWGFSNPSKLPSEPDRAYHRLFGPRRLVGMIPVPPPPGLPVVIWIFQLSILLYPA